MPKSMEICVQANNSTLQATPAGAKSDYSARANNLTHSSSDPAVQAFVQFLQLSFPELTKIRFKRHYNGKFYVLRVKSATRRFAAKGFTVQNTVRNFMSTFQTEKGLAV